MVTPSTDLDVFNSPQMSEVWGVVVEYVGLIASVLGLLGFIGWIAGFRPRARRVSQTSFIDCESDNIFEEIKYNISWGHVFFLRKIKLPRIERNAAFKVLCKPLGAIKDTLHMDNYSERSSGSTRIIYLVNKSFFKREEIESIFLEITRSAPEGYRSKIEMRQTSRMIEVLNRNHVEIRGFPVKLPRTITLNKILAYSAFFNCWETSGNGITVFLKSIPPCIGEKPGKATILF